MIISKKHSPPPPPPPHSHSSPPSLFMEEEEGSDNISNNKGTSTPNPPSNSSSKIKHVVMLPFRKVKRRLWVHQMNTNHKPSSSDADADADADAAAAAAIAATETTFTNHASHPGKRTKKSKCGNNKSRRTNSSSTSGCKKKLMSLNLCFMHPLTKGGGDSPSQSQSQTSDPNSPRFSYDFLKALIETNDFSSKDCNSHSHSHVSPTY